MLVKKWKDIILLFKIKLTRYYVEDGVPFYRSKEIIDRYNKREIQSEFFIREDKFREIKSKFGVLQKDDILLTAVGTIGIPYLVKENDRFYFKDGNLLWFKEPNSELVISEYLYMIMQSSYGQDKFKAISTGTAQAALTIKGLKQIEIPLPPLEEQQRIADLFQSIEQSITQAEAQDRNLLKLKNQLLRDSFGDKQQLGSYLKAEDFEKVKFEKLALNISERVEPKQTKLDTYVGLEHLNSDDLMIRRKGKPEDVIGTKLKIYKGDIIFGKRRAYLRKVAVSDFDGIASAHSMILRANEKQIEKDFLPYLIQSDEFMSRAVQISEGSLSPTIKWKVLAQQEFNVPKKEKQTALADLFKQFDAAREAIKQQTNTLKTLKQKLLNEILG